MKLIGVAPAEEPAETSNTSTPGRVHNSSWLDAVSGAFDNSPLYHQILENEREARRRDDEQFIILE